MNSMIEVTSSYRSIKFWAYIKINCYFMGNHETKTTKQMDEDQEMTQSYTKKKHHKKPNKHKLKVNPNTKKGTLCALHSGLVLS